jgi:hypothetical protein
MTIDLGTLTAIVIPSVGAIFWLARLEGRINVNDVRHEEIVRRLTRIELKVDQLNGHHE